MRNVLAVITLVILSFTRVSGAADSLFSRANEHYTAGEFEQALELYQQIIAGGVESPDLYYNMGNAAYRSNRLGYAILYYEKTLKIEPGHEEAEKNLEFVSMYREDKLEAVPELFLKRWYRRMVSALAVNSWAIISIILFAIVLTGTIGYIFGRSLRLKQAGFFGGMVALLLFSISLSATVKRHRQFSNPEAGIIVVPSVVVKSTPGTAGTDLFILHEGTRVFRDETVGDWTEIRISDGRVGWLPRKSFELI